MDATKLVPSSSDSSSISMADLIHGSSITSTKLYGKNYLSWSAAIQTFLTSKDKLNYIEEDKPATVSSTWAKEDAQVRSWLWNSMEPHVACNVMLLPTAYAVWTSVWETFALDGNAQRIYDLCGEIFLTKQGTSPLHELYSSIKAKWEELNLYQPFPTTLAIWKKQREDLMVVSFLAALGPGYESAKNQILTGSDLPTLNATFSRLSRIHVAAEMLPATADPPTLAAISSSPFGASRGRGRGRSYGGRGGGRSSVPKEDRWCSFCKKSGHLEDKCWKKHGRPDWANKMDDSTAAIL